MSEYQEPPRKRVIQPFSDEQKTQQSLKDEANINSIIRRWRHGHAIPENFKNPVYGDFSNVDDYMGALNRVKSAQEEFLRLPSEVRKRVQNNPGRFLEMCQTREGLEELQGLGLEVELAPPTEPVQELRESDKATATETPVEEEGK